jgi:hypothetical protein
MRLDGATEFKDPSAKKALSVVKLNVSDPEPYQSARKVV